MSGLLKFFYSIITVISIFLNSLLNPAVINPEENADISFLQYPSEAVITLEQAGLTSDELTERASAKLEEYVQSGGYDDIGGVLVSPYYTATVCGKDIPVYASMVFNRSEDTGALHSFSEIYVEPDTDFSFNITLTGKTVKLNNAIVLPSTLGIGAACKNNVVTATINKTGIYTFLFNGAKQHYGYTLFVREKIDDDAQIAGYVEEYGAENVTVFESSVHEFDYLNFVGKDNQVLYFRQGAYLIAKHHYNINSAEDENIYIEENALTDNAIGLNRYPFINFFNCSNIIIAGNGAVDLSRLDRRERRGIVFNYCSNVTVRDFKIINSPEWSFITYCCTDVAVENVDILGFRGNADGFAICNTHNATINNCFARTADDEFEVKALGGPMGSKNITFTNCIAWGGYARCFGICGEVSRSIENVTFRDCAVVYRDGVWDNNRIGSLVIVAEQCDGSIDGVTFENIEIFRDEGRPILVKIYDEEKENFELKNVIYKSITYTSYMPAKIAGNPSSTNTVQVTLENITANGNALNRPGLLLEADNKCDITFN